MIGRLDGKTAILTGGARGQGAAEARALVAEGAAVVIGDVLDEEGRSLADELGDAAAYLHHDVAEEADWDAATTLARERFGGLDVLVNNAAIYRPVPLERESAEGFLRTVAVNQLGVLLGMRHAVGPMRERGGGSIVNVSSISGIRAYAGSITYSASKWAVRGMSKVAARELAPLAIRVNSLHPGLIDTPMLAENPRDVVDELPRMVPMGRLGVPDDITGAVVFLASDESSYVSGAELTIDGAAVT